MTVNVMNPTQSPWHYRGDATSVTCAVILPCFLTLLVASVETPPAGTTEAVALLTETFHAHMHEAVPMKKNSLRGRDIRLDPRRPNSVTQSLLHMYKYINSFISSKPFDSAVFHVFINVPCLHFGLRILHNGSSILFRKWSTCCAAWPW